MSRAKNNAYSEAKTNDKNQDTSEPKKCGGQKGNKNAVGHGAPKNNKNAETHGAYSAVYLESLSPSERAYIENMSLEAGENLRRELKLLFAKERDLVRKISEYEQAPKGALYVDRVVEVFIPKTSEDEDGTLRQSTKTVVKSSRFERLMKLESEYNKIHGRILKLVDSVRAYEGDKKRIDLEKRKHELLKQRLTGEYNVDPDTGEIKDTSSTDDSETEA